MRPLHARACNRSAALHGSRFAPMCSALLPVTAVKEQSNGNFGKLLSSRYGTFDSGNGESDQHSCNLIVKGLFVTCPGFPLIPVVIDGNCTIELGVVTRYSDAAPLMPWLSRSSVQGANP